MGFASWLIGLPVQQPREYGRLRAIRKRVYTRIAGLDAAILRSPEPIPFAQLDRSGFTPLRDGTAWGEQFDCAWLHITGEVPDGIHNPVVMLGVRGEGLVVGGDGELLDSVSTVFQQGDLPHSGGRYRPVQHVDTSTGRVDFFADVTYNGFILYDLGKAVYHGAYLATRDDEVFALYYDYLTLVVFAGATDDAKLKDEVRTALAASYVRFDDDDIPGARAALAPCLAAPSESEFDYHAVGHGHLDMAWLWPLRETRRKAARTYVKALNAIDERPDYVYGTSQPQQMQWMSERHPALYARLREAITAGRVEVQGIFWVEPDTNLPSGESLVRQALVGRRFQQEQFGLTDEQLRLCWLPDTFGYNGNLPQILKKSGMDWFQTIKLAWNKVNDFPHRTFHWQGIDGSTVLVHMPPEGDYNSRGAADGLLTGIRQYPERDLGAALLVYGSGDGGGGPGEIHHEVVARERNLRGLPRVTHSSASDFFRRLETLDVEHTHVGELYLETHQGTYTTQAQIKRHNRLVERMLHEVEALAVLTGDDSRPVLEQHWRDVLLNQFHDIIPGSSIERVNRESIQTYEAIETSLADYRDELIARIPRGSVGATAINLTSMPRREYVRVGSDWQHADVDAYAAAALTPAEPVSELGFTDTTMTNGVLTLRFGPSGEIVSCVDAAGAEHAAAGLNRLVLHRDPYQWPFDAWDIDAAYTSKPPRTLRMTHLETVIDGPMVVRHQVHRSAKVTIDQRVILEAGSSVVRFDTTVEWHETHRMLRAEFRPVHFGATAKSEIQFGHIARVTTENDAVEKAQFETCAHKWIATETPFGGFALLNDSKYGHRAKNGLVSLNLLRSPTFPDKTADRGIHHFTYELMPYRPGELQTVVAEGYRLNNPLIVAEGVEFASLISVDDPAVIVETVKIAESGDAVIVRLYESLGRPASVGLSTTLPHDRAVETDLIERELGPVDLTAIEFTPFEIKTIRMERA